MRVLGLREVLEEGLTGAGFVGMSRFRRFNILYFLFRGGAMLRVFDSILRLTRQHNQAA